MGIQVNIGEAKTRLSELVAASLKGEEVTLSKAGKPVARIVALDDAIEEVRAERKAKIRAWIGSKKHVFDDRAGDLFSEAAFTNDELDSFGVDIG